MATPQKNQKDESVTKVKSLADLRKEIDSLEKEITDRKRKELILAETRSKTKELYTWKAPERPFDPKNRNWFIWVAVVAIITIIIAILTDTLLLVVAVIAVVAVLYIQNTIPPMIFSYTLTNKGLRINDKMYIWSQMPAFWITQRGTNTFIHFRLVNQDQSRLTLLVGDGDINIIAKELVRFIDYLSPKEASTDFILGLTEGRYREIGDFFAKEKQPENPTENKSKKQN
jgi:hypothetical protein